MITMTLGGLWHGAAWTFVIWGLLHGLGVAVSQFARRWFGGTRRMPRWLAVLITFHIVTALWIFFRAPDLATAGTIAAGPFIGTLGDPARFFSAHAFHLALLAVFFLAHPFDDHRRIRLFVRRAPAALYWPAIAFLWVLAITISTGSSAKFIYFDF
jgi:alginate O-acetyltransferase complex protein AlgI